MAAAAHTPGGYGGVPQSVGKDFNDVDTGTSIRKIPSRARGKVSTKAAAKMATGSGSGLVTGHSALDRNRRGGR